MVFEDGIDRVGQKAVLGGEGSEIDVLGLSPTGVNEQEEAAGKYANRFEHIDGDR